VPTSQVWNTIKQFQFIHVYGSLGYLPGTVGTENDAIPFGAAESPDVSYKGLALGRAESLINIVHDDHSEQQFAGAHQLLHTGDTKQIFFFGFAFGKENVDRLQTRQIPASTSVFCTTYKMTSAEIEDSVKPAFTSHPLNTGVLVFEDASIKEFLRNRIWVFR
jgi:hypothetical protein